MSQGKWLIGAVGFQDRMPAIALEEMTEPQRRAAEALITGPRGDVKGPFIPLIRSPELMDRLQKVGEYLRFKSSLEPRISEFIMLIVSRDWTQHYEWLVHVPLGRKAGLNGETVAALAQGRRPEEMREDEQIVYEFCDELFRTKGVSDGTYWRAAARFGENGVIDILGVVGYFTTVSMVMNVAHTPPPDDESAAALLPYPL